jgi:hypothetical protein
MGSSEAPVACSEMALQASAAVAKPPKAPDGVVASGAAAGLLEAPESLDDDGVLAAVGAEQAVSATAAKREVTVSMRAKFFTVHISWIDSPPAGGLD